MKLRIAVCDDENEALTRESRLIKELLDEKCILYDIDEYTSADKLLSANLYDMVFLDVEMGDVNGINVAKKLLESKSDTYIFFITNYSIYSDMASDIHAHRYLSKPVDRDRLSNGIDSALKKIIDSTKFIKVTDKETKKKYDVPISSIIFIENAGRHTECHLISGLSFVAEEIFSVVKERIESEVDYFAMPHQSYYINTRFVSDYNKKEVKMSYGQKTFSAIMSRTRYKAFNDKMFEMAKLL
ncbi:MAG: LytTR family DNA-binding domain-containing protein [bacterium]|nr:LytTR family DNA-binding domain-containing protein [bacterium]